MEDYVGMNVLTNELAEYLNDKITVTDMGAVYMALHAILPHYNIQKIESRDTHLDYLGMFCEAKRAEGRAESTINRYRYIMNQFFNAEKASSIEVTGAHIRDFIVKEQERGISNSTINGTRDVLNSYFGWLFNEGIIRINPCANVGTLKVQKKIRTSFSDVEMSKILNACGRLRDQAIIMFLASTGCRVSEITQLYVKDVSIEAREAIVVGKGDKIRKVYFDEPTAWVLDRYLKHTKATPDMKLFRSHEGNEGMTNSGVRYALKQIEKKSKVDNIHPHRFRRTFATNAVKRKMPLEEVKALLGHTKLDTTMKYVYQSEERTKMAYEYYLG